MLLVSSCSCLYPIRWSQVFSWEWRCSWSSADRRCSNYIWVINHLIANWSASYIRDLTVILNYCQLPENHFTEILIGKYQTILCVFLCGERRGVIQYGFKRITVKCLSIAAWKLLYLTTLFFRFSTLYVLNFQKEQKHIFTFYVIPPHWHDPGS